MTHPIYGFGIAARTEAVTVINPGHPSTDALFTVLRFVGYLFLAALITLPLALWIAWSFS